MGKKKGGVRIKQVGPKGPAMPINPMEDFMKPPPPDEMIQLPPAPDRKYQIFWPIHESFSMDTTGFQVIYPSYLDSDKTVAQGRRISRAQAVPRPTVSDLSLALQGLQVRHVLQPYKGYSRDVSCQWDNPGRVLVDVSQHNKKQLLRLMAQAIPDLPERVARLEKEAAEQAAAEEERKKQQLEQQKAKQTAASKKAGAATKKGKKGKRK